MNTKLNYDPNTGLFTRLIQTSSNARVGDIAGFLSKGYIRIQIDGKVYYAHRIAWFFHHGNWPADGIDHINGIRDDNRISNLREATSAENHQNRCKRRDNSSGYLGVSREKSQGKYRAQIRVNGKQINLGYFADKEDAKQAYLDAKANLHQFNPIQR